MILKSSCVKIPKIALFEKLLQFYRRIKIVAKLCGDFLLVIFITINTDCSRILPRTIITVKTGWPQKRIESSFGHGTGVNPIFWKRYKTFSDFLVSARSQLNAHTQVSYISRALASRVKMAS